jgi:hypothetical protein
MLGRVMSRVPPLRHVLLTLVAVLVLAGCTQLEGAAYDVEDELLEAGFRNAYVSYVPAGDQGAVLVVTYDSDQTDGDAMRRESTRVLRLVWLRAPMRLAKVDVDPSYPQGVDVPVTVSRTDEQLREEFGPRDPALDTVATEDLDADSRAGLLVMLVLVVVLLVGGLVAAVLLVRRDRRARAARAAQAAHAPWQRPGENLWGPGPYW